MHVKKAEKLMDHLGKVLAESRATLHLIEGLDRDDIHGHEVVTHAVLLGCTKQKGHDQVQMVVEDLWLKLG